MRQLQRGINNVKGFVSTRVRLRARMGLVMHVSTYRYKSEVRCRLGLEKIGVGSKLAKANRSARANASLSGRTRHQYLWFVFQAVAITVSSVSVITRFFRGIKK